MKIKIFLIIIVTSFCDQTSDGLQYASPKSSASEFTPFPKILWIYWASGMDSAMLWTKLSINNIHHYSKLSGWQIAYLTDQNYTKVLSPANNVRLTKILDNRINYKLTVQAKADILKALLMYEHGGAWMDVGSFFVQDLSWVDRLYELPNVFNRFVPDPDVILFTKNKDYSGNKTKIFDKQFQQEIYLFPGAENWFLLAKPGSQFFKDVIVSIERSLVLGRKKVNKYAAAREIKFGNEVWPYYFMGNFQYQLVLQGKQKTIDKLNNPSIKYAVQHYKIWNIYSEYTASLLLSNMEAQLQMDILLEYSVKNLSNLFAFQVQPLFFKIIHDVSYPLNEQMKKFDTQNCWQVSNVVQPQSIFYQHLINITAMIPELDKLKRTFNYLQNGQCYDFGRLNDFLTHTITIIKIIILAALVITIIVVSLQFTDNSKRYKGFQRVKMIE